MSFDFRGSNPREPDPLDGVEYTGGLQEDSRREFSALREGFKARLKREKSGFSRATDSEFWFAVCFRSREDKEAFLSAIRARRSLMGDKYLDGYKLAKLLGVEMPED